MKFILKTNAHSYAPLSKFDKMRKKLLLLFVGFIVVYYFIHLAIDLPNLINGTSRFSYLPRQLTLLVYRFTDITISFLFALIPYLLLFKWYEKKQLVPLFLLIPASIAVIFFIHYKMADFISESSIRLRIFFLQSIFYYMVFVLYGLIFYFIRYSYFRETQQRELAIQNRQAELLFLRSQVNPHFLFNSLNNIYSLVYSKSDHALEAIAGLSDLLRYLLYHADEQVNLEEELKYIRKYIELQRLRFEHPINATLHVTGAAGQVKISPLLLIPFIENAFKHGDFSGDEGLLITVQVHEKETRLFCLNKKGNQQKDGEGGIGLDNVRRRLQLLYPGKHVLHIDDNEQQFIINLTLMHD